MLRFQHHRDLPGHTVSAGTAVSIGNFDGVHLGHQAIVSSARDHAHAQRLILSVLTFEPHPCEVLAPQGKRMRLASPTRKAQLLEDLGVGLLLAQKVDTELLSMTADDFCFHVLSQALSARAVVVGENFRFGRGRRGDIDTLTARGNELGFEVFVSKLLRIGDEPVSSTRLRKLIANGAVSQAAKLLGRPHELSGFVVHGHGKGRTLGFPTINLSSSDVLLPAKGIYAAMCHLSEEPAPLPAAVYLGSRPTLGHGDTLEAHLIGASGDYYGRAAKLQLIERLRGEERFASESLLRSQMARDIENATRVLEGYHE
jgi:riboflavin kinase/FMN adenylyltransferase